MNTLSERWRGCDRFASCGTTDMGTVGNTINHQCDDIGSDTTDNIKSWKNYGGNIVRSGNTRIARSFEIWGRTRRRGSNSINDGDKDRSRVRTEISCRISLRGDEIIRTVCEGWRGCEGNNISASTCTTGDQSASHCRTIVELDGSSSFTSEIKSGGCI